MPEAISMAGFQSGDKETFNHAFNKQIGFFIGYYINAELRSPWRI